MEDLTYCVQHRAKPTGQTNHQPLCCQPEPGLRQDFPSCIPSFHNLPLCQSPFHMALAQTPERHSSEAASVAHAAVLEQGASVWLMSHNIPHLCTELELLHCGVCWKAMGFGASASNRGLIETSLFHGENSAGRCDLRCDECGLDAANRAFQNQGSKEEGTETTPLSFVFILESFHTYHSGACEAVAAGALGQDPGMLVSLLWWRNLTMGSLLHTEVTKLH